MTLNKEKEVEEIYGLPVLNDNIIGYGLKAIEQW